MQVSKTKSTETNSDLLSEFEAVKAKEVEVGKKTRSVRLKLIVGCGCGGGSTNIEVEIPEDMNFPYDDYDYVDSYDLRSYIEDGAKVFDLDKKGNRKYEHGF